MPNIGLTKEADKLQKAIYKFGCLTVDQTKYFMPPTNRVKEDYHVSICNYLTNSKYTIMQNDCIYPARNMDFSQGMIDSVWVMKDMLTNDEDDLLPLSDKMDNAFRAEEPETICFIKDGQLTVKIIPIESIAQVPLLSFIQEKFYAVTNAEHGEELRKKCLMVIVIRSKDLLPEISKLDLTMPHKIALLTGELDKEPVIKYYGMSIKK